MYYVYIMTNKWNTVLYVGVTDNIQRRITEHKAHVNEGFTSRYNITKCVFVQEFSNVNDALASEKKLKGWTRRRKFELISQNNPTFQDLFY